jgi:PAS domain S-box-containing protein
VTTHLKPRASSPSPSAGQADRLFAAALAIVSARTVDDMLRETAVRAAEIIGAHQALASLSVDRDASHALTHVHASPKYAEHTFDPATLVRSGPLAEVSATNRPVRLTQEDLERRPDWPPPGRAGREATDPPMCGLLAVPLVGREGRNLGLIQLSDRSEGEFDAADEQVLTSLAQFTAMAIEQLRLHADLAYQSRLTRTVSENATSGLFLMDARGRLTYMNSAGRRIIGYEMSELAGRTLHEVIHHSRPDGTPLPLADCRIWRAVLGSEGALGPAEDWFIHPDGTFYPVRIAATPVLRDQRLVSIVLEVQDISVERAVARRLRDLAVSASDRAAKLRGLIEAIGDAVVVCEPDRSVSLMNPAAVEMFGPLADVDELLERLRGADGSTMGPGTEIGGSYLLGGSAPDTWVEARAFPVPLVPARTDGRADEVEGPAVPGRIYILRDVTASRQAKVLRETFIGMLSHELRTPITTVYGGTKLLSRRAEELDPALQSMVGDIEAEAERLYRLVEDLVVLTKSEALTLETGREPLLVQRLLPRLVAAEARRWPTLEFSVECASDLAPVMAEPTYIEQVVRNLLTNAAKYGGAAGLVEVTATAGDDDEVVVRVMDRGPGFPEEEAGRLFDIYYRSPQVARRAAGAGIGLFVCKALIDAMAGRIWARERPGGGAEFGFALPGLVEPADRGTA